MFFLAWLVPSMTKNSCADFTISASATSDLGKGSLTAKRVAAVLPLPPAVTEVLGRVCFVPEIPRFPISRGSVWERTLPTAVRSIAVGRTSCWERAGPGWRRTKGLRCFQVSRAARDARRKRLFPHARAAGGTSRSSTEQRPTEQSRSTAAAVGCRAGKLGSSRAEDAGGRKGAATWLPPASQSHEQQQDPFLSGATTIGNAKCWLRERGGFTPRCHLLSHLPGIFGDKLSSALCHGM